MRKWKMFALILLLMAVFLPIQVIAHPGRTDSAGGHTNHSTGEYHYHHGESAHDHYDMDGDGDIDCPYDFVDTTGQNSGNSSYGGSTGTSASLSNSESYDRGYDRGYDVGYDEGYKRAGFDLQAETEEELASEKWNIVSSTLLITAVIGLPVMCFVHNKWLKASSAKIQQEMNREALKKIAPGAEEKIKLPKGVWLDLQVLPVKGEKTSLKPYGDLTVYTSANGTRYHSRYGCSGASRPLHIYEIGDKMSPCSNCVKGGRTDTLPEWYCQIKGLSKAAIETAEPSGALPESETRLLPDSSCIKKAEFKNNALYITFQNGNCYEYYNATREVYDGLIAAPSMGKYYQEKIKGKYPYLPYRK